MVGDMQRPRTIGGWCFAIYVVVRGIMDLLGAIDFIVERTSDPGWLSTAVRYLVDPPAWVPLLLALAALGLILWPDREKNWPRRPTVKDAQLIAPLFIIIVSTIGLLVGIAWLITAQKNAESANANLLAGEQWDAAKIAILDQIFRILKHQMEPAYDALGDKYASPWRKRILEIGPQEYVKEIHAGLRGTAKPVGDLSALLEAQAIYPDLVEEFRGGPEQQNKLVAAANEFQAELQHLSDQPEERNLNLVKTEAEAFKSAVGAFGQWARAHIQKAVELKQAAAPQPAGTWKNNRYIYDAPRLIQTFSVGPEDEGRFFRFRVNGVASESYVQFKVEYDGGIATALIVPHEKQQVNWRRVTRKTQAAVRLRNDNTTVLKVHVPPQSDMTVIRIYALWWEKPDG